jgi:purine-binding chemotaxis protein CheW
MPIALLAGLPPFVLGAATIRGTPAPVLDAGELVAGRRQASPTRFVMLKAGERRVALAVDAVLGARALPENLFGSLAPLFSGASREVIRSLAGLDGELLIALEAARAVPDAVWTALDGAA